MPIASSRTSRPSAFIQPTTRSRPALSSSVSASRAQPPPSMAPIRGQGVEQRHQQIAPIFTRIRVAHCGQTAKYHAGLIRIALQEPRRGHLNLTMQRLLALLAGCSAVAGPAFAHRRSCRRTTCAPNCWPRFATVKPGEPFWVGLRQTIRPKWHTYWKNPGDSGLPTEIAWKLPEGVKADPIVWPAPSCIDIGGDHQLRLRGRGRAAGEDHAAGRSRRALALAADANWLVCEDVCIPEEGKFALDLPSGLPAKPAAPAHAALFDKARRRADGKPVARALTASPSRRSDPVVEAKGLKPERSATSISSPPSGARSPAWPSRRPASPPRASGSRSRRATPRRPCRSRLAGTLVLTEKTGDGDVTQALRHRREARSRHSCRARRRSPPRTQARADLSRCRRCCSRCWAA